VKDFSIYEVGPRDGLQNLEHVVSLDDKVKLIHLLHEAALSQIEVGSFVNPKMIPNMASSSQVFEQVRHLNPDFSVLIPNAVGLQRAEAVNATKFNIFVSPNEKFNSNNLGGNSTKVIWQYQKMLKGHNSVDVRIYIPLAFTTPLDSLLKCVEAVSNLGSTIVLCDTDGSALPSQIEKAIFNLQKYKLAVHLHQGYSNIALEAKLNIAYDCGVREFDSSIGGMGGCPLVKGSGQNLATEKLIEWGLSRNLDCGVSLEGIQEAKKFALRLSKKEMII